MTYISATQNGIVRCDKQTDEKYSGLHTSGLQTCWAIIIYNKKTGRISLVHKTGRTDPGSIIHEFKWVGLDNLEWLIVRNKYSWTDPITQKVFSFADKFDEKLQKFSLAIKHLKIPSCCYSSLSLRSNAGVYIDRNDFKITAGFFDSESILTEPSVDSVERDAINKINEYLLTDDDQNLIAADLQYDGNTWLPLPKILCEANFCQLSLENLSDIKELFTSEARVIIILAQKIKEKGNEYFRSGNYGLAKGCYKRCVLLNPDFPEAFFNLGVVYQKLQKISIARGCWTRAVSINPDYERAKQKLNETKGSSFKQNLAKSGVFGTTQKSASQSRQKSDASTCAKPG